MYCRDCFVVLRRPRNDFIICHSEQSEESKCNSIGLILMYQNFQNDNRMKAIRGACPEHVEGSMSKEACRRKTVEPQRRRLTGAKTPAPPPHPAVAP